MRMLLRRYLPLAVAVLALPHACCFLIPTIHTQHYSAKFAGVNTNNDSNNLDLKEELTAYLDQRRQSNADQEAKAEVGKVVGGTKGNKVLEFVSGAPNKAFVIEEEPNVFDYDQLTKYGYGHLVTPIMNAGGRLECYKLMDMEPPKPPPRKKPKSAPKLVIDRKGESDPARYSGLKMGQVLDDEAMARALEDAMRKKKQGESLRPKLVEESYVPPFADKRNTGPRQTPDWTAERLDEEGIKRGKALAWAKKAKAGEFVQDPYEVLSVEGGLRAYSVLVAVLVAFAFGRATPTLFDMVDVDGSAIQELIQIPAAVAIVAAVGSSIVNGVVMAPEKKRSSFVWAVKGLFGGPVAIAELRSLGTLQTRGEMDANDNS